MIVSIHCEAYSRVPQALCGHLGMNAGCTHKSRMSVTKVMEDDSLHSRLVDEPVKLTGQCPRLNIPGSGGGEHPIAIIDNTQLFLFYPLLLLGLIVRRLQRLRI